MIMKIFSITEIPPRGTSLPPQTQAQVNFLLSKYTALIIETIPILPIKKVRMALIVIKR